MIATLHTFAANAPQAQALAAALGIACRTIAVRDFPDGESLVRVAASGPEALLYCPLDHPNAKLVQLLLAASALRDRGARKVTLIAPYLGYMRQDRAFAAGEAVSQRVIGGLIAAAFDALVTVDPHLHRTPRLDDVVPGILAVNVSAAAAISQHLAATTPPDALLVGPDAESRPWVEAIAAPLGRETLIGEKVRHGDRAVQIRLLDGARVAGRPAVLVDDLISSGGTLATCAALLRAAGATQISAVATHCLASQSDLTRLGESGIAVVAATDTVPSPASCMAIAPALAQALLEHRLAPAGSTLAEDPTA